MELRLKEKATFEQKRLKTQYRQYFSNYSLLITLGIVWIVTSSAGIFNVHLSMFSFICGITLSKPLTTMVSKILQTNKINKGSTLKLSTRLLLLGVAIGVSTVFFPFANNTNLFYPAFNIIIGLIFISLSIVSSLRLYFIMGIFMIIAGTYTGYHHPENFYLAGISGGVVMLGAGLLNGVAGKIFMHNFKSNKKKFKSFSELGKTLSQIAPKKKLTENI